MKGFLNLLYYAFVLAVGGLGALLLMVHMGVISGYEMRIVQSGSMEPTIPTGSLILIHERDRYYTNDIITFQIGGRSGLPTTHRIIEDGLEAGKLVYTTKGDANDSVDPEPVYPDEVRGKVVMWAPYLGFLLDFARQPLGFVLLIVLPAALIILEEISSLWKAWRRRQRAAQRKAEAEAREEIS